jgi:glutathione S-transferase
VVSDSWNIAIYLEEKYPLKPSLFPAGTRALQALFQEHLLETVQMSLYLATVPIIHQNLGERSAMSVSFFIQSMTHCVEFHISYFRETREGFLHKKLEELCPRDSIQWQDAWDKAKTGMRN